LTVRLTSHGEGSIFQTMKQLKHTRKTTAAVVAVLLAAILMIGCTIKQQVSLEIDQSGTVSTEIRLDPLFVEYLNDLAELTGESMEEQVFKIEEIKKGFAEREDIELTRIATPSPEILEMEIDFRNIERVFSGEQKLTEAGIVSFTKVSEGYSVRFHLDKSNFDSVLAFMPFLQNPLFEGLGPQENDDTTEEEYFELMELALGEGGAESVQDSYIETRVAVKGELISQSGGTVSNNGVVYRIPLIRVLLLDQPLDYSLQFK